jgi:hypothetical protein
MYPSSGAAPKVNTNASMVYWSGCLLFYGGYYNESSLDLQQTTVLRLYDFTAKTWVIVDSLIRETISEFGMLVYQDTLFTFQGLSITEGYWFKVYKLKLRDVSSQWEEVSYSNDDSFPQYAYAMDEHDGTVWFFGGWSNSTYINSNHTYIDIWNKVTSVDLCKSYSAQPKLVFKLRSAGYDSISPRAGHSLIPIADQLLTFGGRDGSKL